MVRTIDFDQFLKEQKAATGEEAAIPVMFRVGGKDYPLPAELPAVIAIDTVRLKKSIGVDPDVPPEALGQIGNALFGAANFREIVTENHFSITQLGDLLQEAFSAYKDDIEESEPVPTVAPTQTPST